jgi:hypothetical protein
MVQEAPEGQPHFISTMQEHNQFCSDIASAFGNDYFEPPDPHEQMLFVIGNHDRGWDDWDTHPGLDAKTNLPCGLTNTPIPVAIQTNQGSPDFNERHHAYCGLLSSMHSYGLYHARLGVSEFRVRPGGSLSVPINPQFEAETKAMLEREVARQQRLKSRLREDPIGRGWVEEKRLMQNYKLLQFFDTLTLYFHLRHPSTRAEERYVHVPFDSERDSDVVLRPLEKNTYALAPFPFAGDSLNVVCRGRYVAPFPKGEQPTDLGAALKKLPTIEQTLTFVAA